MPTTRTPIGRKPMKQISAEAAEIFKQILALDEQCSCTETSYCEACHQYKDLNDKLRRQLRLSPGQWPTLVPPGQEPSHPPETAGGKWQRDDGPKLYRDLCAAAGIEVEE
jgi:hypothetical protein